MSLLTATQITALATTVLAAGAIVTAILAGLAFRKQSAELRLLGQEAAGQQALSARQAEVLGLQATELRESLDERKRQAEEQQQAQASQVAAWLEWGTSAEFVFQGARDWGARIRNESSLPIYSVRVSYHLISTDDPESDQWEPVRRGSSETSIRVVAPRSERFILIPRQLRDEAEPCDDSTWIVSITFTDASGQRWERDPRGALHSRT